MLALALEYWVFLSKVGSFDRILGLSPDFSTFLPNFSSGSYVLTLSLKFWLFLQNFGSFSHISALASTFLLWLPNVCSSPQILGLSLHFYRKTNINFGSKSTVLKRLSETKGKFPFMECWIKLFLLLHINVFSLIICEWDPLNDLSKCHIIVFKNPVSLGSPFKFFPHFLMTINY